MTRKEICEFIYVFGGLFILTIVATGIFVNLDDEGWTARILLSFFLGLISAPIGGCILGAITYMVLLPFRKKIPWDMPLKPNKYIYSPQKEIIVLEPIYNRYEILDL